MNQLDIPSKMRASSSASIASEAHRKGQKHDLRVSGPTLDSKCSHNDNMCNNTVGEKRAAHGGEKEAKRKKKKKKRKKA